MGNYIQHKKSLSQIVLTIITTLFVFIGSYLVFIKMDIFKEKVHLSINLKVNKNQDITLYYTDGGNFSETKAITQNVISSSKFQDLIFTFPPLTQLNKLRLDFGTDVKNIQIKGIDLYGYGKRYSFKNEKLHKIIEPINGIDNINLENKIVKFNTIGNDPYFHLKFNIKGTYSSLTQNYINILPFTPKVKIIVNAQTERTRNMQLFYSNNNKFNEEQKIEQVAYSDQNFHDITFVLPQLDSLKKIRLDPTSGKFKVDIKTITFSNWMGDYKIEDQDLYNILQIRNDIEKIEFNDSIISINSNGNDPYLFINTNVNFIYKQITTLPFKIVPFLFSLILSVLIAFWLLNLTSNSFNINTNGTLVNIFMVMITLPLMVTIFSKESSFSHLENRNKAIFPKLKSNQLFEYPKKLTPYINDNIGFREEVLLTNSIIKTKLLGVSPLPRKATLGKDNWLYLAKDTDPKYNKASQLFTIKELKNIQENLEQRANFLNQQNIKFYFLVAPSKSTIYPEFLPNNLKNNNPSRLKQLFAHLKKHSFVKIIDIRKELLTAKKHTNIYYKSDSHWNEKGAFIAYKKLINTIKKDFPSLNPLQEHELILSQLITYDGDLAEFLLLQKHFPVTKSSLDFVDSRKNKNIKSSTTKKNINGRDKEIRIIRKSTQPKMVMYRDSYSISLTPLLNGHFSNVLYLWDYNMIPETIHLEKPDLVILEMYERSLDALLTKKY